MLVLGMPFGPRYADPPPILRHWQLVLKYFRYERVLEYRKLLVSGSPTRRTTSDHVFPVRRNNQRGSSMSVGVGQRSTCRYQSVMSSAQTATLQSARTLDEVPTFGPLGLPRQDWVGNESNYSWTSTAADCAGRTSVSHNAEDTRGQKIGCNFRRRFFAFRSQTFRPPKHQRKTWLTKFMEMHLPQHFY